MKKTIAIIQSCYIPWKGYFDIINSVDEFVFYDEVQFTKNDWRNRNIVKSANGPQWLTIPVLGSMSKPIKDIQVANKHWCGKHWKTLQNLYSKSKYFNEYKYHFESLYDECENVDNLSSINFKFIEKICNILKISTKLSYSHEYSNKSLCNNKTSRLIELCNSTNATTYLSGPLAKNYIEESSFTDAGIGLEYIEYTGYPVYKQLYGEFIHNVSIIDLLFNEGPNFNLYMKSFKGAL